MPKVAVAIELTETERGELESLARAQKTGQALAKRARIVLAAAEGLENKAIVAGVGSDGEQVAAAAMVAGIVWLLGFEVLLWVNLPIILLAASLGVWLFYVQHQFEHTIWDHDADWSWHEAAFHGSSHYDLPTPLRWLTGNIGLHHIHHLCSRIPCYRLPRVLKDYPELAEVGRIGLMDSLRCVRLVRWDERTRRLVSFREAAAA